MLACEELTKLVTCGSDSERSTSISLPRLVTLAAMRMSLLPRPSSSRKASPWKTPSFQVLTTARACASAASSTASTAASTTGPVISRNSFCMRRSPRCAAPIMGVADVERDHVEDVVAQLALLIELDRRNADAYLPDLDSVRVVSAMR